MPSNPDRRSRTAERRLLRALAAAGLLTSHREGYYVLYALVPEALDALGDELRGLTAP